MFIKYYQKKWQLPPRIIRGGYNIDSLTVCETNKPGQSRMTIVVNGDEYILEPYGILEYVKTGLTAMDRGSVTM